MGRRSVLLVFVAVTFIVITTNIAVFSRLQQERAANHAAERFADERPQRHVASYLKNKIVNIVATMATPFTPSSPPVLSTSQRPAMQVNQEPLSAAPTDAPTNKPNPILTIPLRFPNQENYTPLPPSEDEILRRKMKEAAKLRRHAHDNGSDDEKPEEELEVEHDDDVDEKAPAMATQRARAPYGNKKHHHKIGHQDAPKHNHQHARKIQDNSINSRRHPKMPPANNVSFNDALDTYRANMDAFRNIKVAQSSASFHDMKEVEGNGVLLPRNIKFPEPATASEDDWKACDPNDADFTSERDARCLRYMSNPMHIASMKPMSAMLYSGRTIKFRIFYDHGGLQAVLKVSQRKFALEPISEVAAFHVDRYLGFRRAPPQAWVEMPVDFMRAASAVMEPMYSKWFEDFVPTYKSAQRLIHLKNVTVMSPDYKNDGKTHQVELEVMNVSIGLWMHDVHQAEDTVIAPPDNYNRLMNPGKTSAAQHWRNKSVNISLAEIGDLMMYDYIIDNTDRSPRHNSFAYGGCEGGACKPPPPGEQIVGTPKLAYIDQGSAFYHSDDDFDSPFADKNHAGWCRFRASTVEHFRAKKDQFMRDMKSTLGDLGIFPDALPERLILASARRFNEMLKIFDDCEAKFGDNIVSFFTEE